jgi:hypothetical protein
LVTITVLLNVLLWSSCICLVASIYQIETPPPQFCNTAVSSSSRSGSTGPDGRNSLSSDGDAYGKATPSETAYAILSGTPLPSTANPKGRNGHMRTASAPDATSGAQQPVHAERMAIGWKPQLIDLDLSQKQESGSLSVGDKPIKIVKLVHSLSEGFLSRFSPDTSPVDNLKKPRQELERKLDARLIIRKLVPGRSRSADPMRHSSAPTIAEAAAAMVSNMPHDLETPKNRSASAEAESKRRIPFDELKNKPLLRIAVL